MNAQQRYEHDAAITHVTTIDVPLIGAQTEAVRTAALQTTRVAAVKAATDATLTGIGRHWPERERVGVVRSAERDYEHQVERLAGDLQRTLDETAPDVDRLVAVAKEAPSPVEAAYRHTGSTGLTLGDELALLALDEQVRQRLDRQLGAALPSAVLAAYGEALGDPYDPRHASTIRYVESAHGAGWAGASSSDREEQRAVQHLRARIGEAREARVPTALKDSQAKIVKARGMLAQVRALGHRAVQPEDEA